MIVNRTSSNVAVHVRAMAQSDPDRKAVVCAAGRDASGKAAYAHLTFAQLDQESDRIARGLLKIGIGRGTRTVLMVKPSLDFFSLTFALFKVGAVIVMIDPGIGRKRLGVCLREAEPEAFIGIPPAQVARLVLGWGKQTIKTIVTVGHNPFWGGYRLADLRIDGDQPLVVFDPEPDEMAAILFTSGSTGVPKGAIYTHGIFSAQVDFLQTSFRFEGNEIDLATFPLFALFDPALGMTAVIPEMDASKPAKADPKKLIEAIHDQGVTQMFGSPALVDRLGRYALEQNIQLPTLRRVLSAGAPVRPDILERLKQVLGEEAEIYTPYGATEALPVALIESREILSEMQSPASLGNGNCVGRPVEQVRVRIIGITDEPIEQWSDDLLAEAEEVGEIVVDGPVVTPGYYGRDASTKLAKIAKPEGGVVHRMGDLGRFDTGGRLWFCGRKSHRVIAQDRTYFSIPCERIFNAHPQVFRTALAGVGPKGHAEPILCVELEKGEAKADQGNITRELLELGAAHKSTEAIRKILFHPSFPIDARHNAKIDREALSTWAQGELR